MKAAICSRDDLTLCDTGYAEAFEKTIRHVAAGVGSQYSCASVAIGRGDELLLKLCVGNRQDYSGDVPLHADPKPVDMDTLYDMASVSKLMSTTMVALRLLEDGYFSLYDSLWRYFDDCGNYADVELRHLMTHTSGVPAHLPLYTMGITPDESIPTILHSRPVCAIGAEVNYSCMGYMLLQAVLEKVSGAPLDVLARELVFEPLGMKTACYCPVSENVAATEYSPHEHRYICGHVHDENAHFRGGVSGNAGVFATLDDCIRFASMLSGRGVANGAEYLCRHTFEAAVRNYTKPLGESRGLGFAIHGGELSASGELMSPDSYGHNGYTGTSIYVDGANGLYFVLLTNSVHYGRDGRAPFFRSRRLFHNLALCEAGRLSRAACRRGHSRRTFS